MCIALNGLAVGMGVIYPNLREENPSKIVSGFGGTFCLVISFIYIGAMLILLSIGSPYGSPWQIWRTSSLGNRPPSSACLRSPRWPPVWGRCGTHCAKPGALSINAVGGGGKFFTAPLWALHLLHASLAFTHGCL